MSDAAHDRRDGRVHLRVASENGFARARANVKARTINIGRLSKQDLELGRRLFPETDHGRPTTRAECANVQRPCPFVSCSHHLYLDVNQSNGSIKLNSPEIEPWEMTESCSLDVADRGAESLEEVGALMNMTREAVRLIQHRALRFLYSLPAVHEAARELGLDTRPIGRMGANDEDDD